MASRILGRSAALTVASLTVSTPAWAHGDTAGASFTAMTLAVPAASGLLVLAAALALLGVRRRGVAALCLALFVLVAFEVGVHSVHHLTDGRDGACAVASTAAHTAGVVVDRIACAPAANDARPDVPVSRVAATSQPASPDRGRAPPTAG